MEIFLFLLFGVITGIVAQLIVARHEPPGFAVSMGVGVIGAFLGGLLGRALGLYASGDPAGLLMAAGGAVLLLFGYHAAAVRRVV